MKRISALVLALLVTAVLAGFGHSRLGQMLESHLATGLPSGLSGHMDRWHLDPFKRELVIEGLAINAGTPMVSMRSLHLHFEGLKRNFKPTYGVSLEAPVITITKTPEGLYRIGPFPIGSSSQKPPAFPLPETISILSGDIHLEQAGDEAPPRPLVTALDLDLKQSDDRHIDHAHVAFSDAISGRYVIDISQPEGKTAFQIQGHVDNADLAVWSEWLPALVSWRESSGLISTHYRITFDPKDEAAFTYAVEDFRAEGIVIRSDQDQPPHGRLDALTIGRWSGWPSRAIHHVEDFMLHHLEGEHFSIEDIKAPHVTTDQHPEGRVQEAIDLTGIRHDGTVIASMHLDAPEPPRDDGVIRFGNLSIPSIDGPKMQTTALLLNEINLDFKTKTLTAERGESQTIGGSFGTLMGLTTRQLAYDMSQELLRLESLEFTETATHAFHSGPGQFLAIAWDRKARIMTARQTKMRKATFHRIGMAEVIADQATLDLNSSLLTIQQLRTRGDQVRGEDPKALPVMQFKGINLLKFHSNPHETRWGAGEVEVEAGQMIAEISPENHLELKGLASGFGSEAPRTGPVEPGKRWTYEIGQIAFRDTDLELVDLGTTPPVRIPFSHINLTADDLASEALDDTDLWMDAQIGSKGHFSLTGRMRRSPLSGVIHFNLRQFRLPLLSPYWAALTRLNLRHGRLDVSGSLHMIPGASTLYEFEGDAHLDHFEALDEKSGRRIIAFKELTIDDMTYSSTPKHFATRVMDWDEAYLHLALDEKRQLNLKPMFGVKDPKAVPSELKDIHIDATPVNEPPRSSVRLLKLRNSRIDYTDHSFNPPLETTVRDIDGTVRGLSSRAEAQTSLDFEGKINRNSPVFLSGTVMPLDYHRHTDLLLSFKGLNLTRFPQYAGRFSGYRIERGKLNLDLRYKIEDDQMDVENRAVIDRLTLGERVEENRHYLTDIALWMLMDPHGNLDVDLPIYGDLEDPSYDLGTLYAEAFTQFFAKIFTTPVGLVGNLIPQDHLALHIPFTAGQSHIDEKALGTLQPLIALYRENEGGIIEITPRSNPNTDRPVMAKAAVMRGLQESYRRELRSKGMAVDAAASMSEAEANRQMILRHRQGGGTPNKVNIAGWNTEAYTPDEVQEAWSNALEETDVSPDLLVDLAEDRADAIREALVKSFGLEDDWIYLKPTELDAADDPITIHIDYIND